MHTTVVIAGVMFVFLEMVGGFFRTINIIEVIFHCVLHVHKLGKSGHIFLGMRFDGRFLLGFFLVALRGIRRGEKLGS